MRWLHIGLCLILLAPLLVWSGFLVPYLTAKVLAFQILVELVAAAALMVVFLEGPRAGRKTGFRVPLIIAAIAAFLGLSLLTALLGTDLNRSLWGLIQRQDGLVLYFHFFAWLLVLAWFFPDRRLLLPRPSPSCPNFRLLFIPFVLGQRGSSSDSLGAG